MIAGSCFGATAALHGRRQKETVTCVTDCEMYTIGGNALRQIARYVDRRNKNCVLIACGMSRCPITCKKVSLWR